MSLFLLEIQFLLQTYSFLQIPDGVNINLKLRECLSLSLAILFPVQHFEFTAQFTDAKAATIKPLSHIHVGTYRHRIRRVWWIGSTVWASCRVEVAFVHHVGCCLGRRRRVGADAGSVMSRRAVATATVGTATPGIGQHRPTSSCMHTASGIFRCSCFATGLDLVLLLICLEYLSNCKRQLWQ